MVKEVVEKGEVREGGGGLLSFDCEIETLERREVLDEREQARIWKIVRLSSLLV